MTVAEIVVAFGTFEQQHVFGLAVSAKRIDAVVYLQLLTVALFLAEQFGLGVEHHHRCLVVFGELGDKRLGHFHVIPYRVGLVKSQIGLDHWCKELHHIASRRNAPHHRHVGHLHVKSLPVLMFSRVDVTYGGYGRHHGCCVPHFAGNVERTLREMKCLLRTRSLAIEYRQQVADVLLVFEILLVGGHIQGLAVEHQCRVSLAIATIEHTF